MITAPPRTASGFTLVEMVIATSILVVAMALAMTGYVYIWAETNKSITQDELDIQVQQSIEEIKKDLRLTALEKIYYFPEGAVTNTAISMPLARDTDGDGAVDVGADGKIVWDRTVIYHVWAGNPTQLRKTTFSPRDNSLTVTQLQEQLNSVATVGNGTATYNSSNATTKVIFQNLFTWSVQPQSSSFDGYSATNMRSLDAVLGSTVLSNGNQTLRFRVTGKNPSSSGYRVGLDTLFMSPSYGVREAEAQLPATAVVGTTIPTNVYMNAGSWSGNYHLSFPATATNQSFTLTLPNDRWEETNFRSTGELHDDTSVFFDTSLAPTDFVVALEGNYSYNWWATNQTGDAYGGQTVADNVKGAAVRVLIRGRNMEPGKAIDFSGGKTWVLFRSGTGPLTITDAFIAEANATDGIATMDAVPGTTTRLRFGGANSLSLSSSGSASWCDQASTFPIDKRKSYLVTYLVSPTAGYGNAWRWLETNTMDYVGAYMIAASNSPTAGTAAAENWSTRSDVYTTNSIPAVWATWVTYPTNGTYTSAIFDTQHNAAPFTGIAWNSVIPSGGYLGMRVRSGNSNDLSDAASWTNLAAMTSPGAINPGNKRYVQFQATLRPSSGGNLTPKLRDVAISWPAETRIVDIGGTFTKGPDYGIFEMLVNGQAIKKGVVVNLEIFDYTRAHGTSNRITSAATTEVTPRNSGR
ncbi:MAG: prepilin-type N-terminal cleavage/methylation domain-containing protein [Lentisphaerae bacterium]|nr:prepilin-type N-terminal cleavage/methylation domain-containing protein [Lentisphaerota bacterium]